MEKHTIKKGNHYHRHPIKFHFNKQRIVFEFMFDESCAYDLGDDNQKDFNKLFGVTFGYPRIWYNKSLNKKYWFQKFDWSIHKDSYRVGCRYNVQAGQMELCHYAYNHKTKVLNQVNDFLLMSPIKLKTWGRSIIDIDREANTIWNKIQMFDVNTDNWITIYSSGINFDFNGVPKFGIYLYPYFGGDEPAPHDMTMYLR